MLEDGITILKVGGVLAFALFITYAIYRLIIGRLKMSNITAAAQTAIVLGIVFLIFVLSIFAVSRLTAHPPQPGQKAGLFVTSVAG